MLARAVDGVLRDLLAAFERLAGCVLRNVDNLVGDLAQLSVLDAC